MSFQTMEDIRPVCRRRTAKQLLKAYIQRRTFIGISLCFIIVPGNMKGRNTDVVYDLFQA